MTIRIAMRVLLLGAVVATVVGVCLITFAAPEPEYSFGWTAYAPLPDTMYSPVGAYALSTIEVVGFALLAAGLAALAFWGGYSLGNRRSHIETAPAASPTVLN
jgi:heme/copper-type cytochrome/quinol oxidase subunit 1